MAIFGAHLKPTMSKFLPCLLLLYSHLSVSAQIPNAGFEDWVDHDGHLDPVGWYTYNNAYNVINVFPESPGAYGNNCAVAVTSSWNNDIGSGAVVGAIFLDAGSPGLPIEGMPYEERPYSLNGYFQYNCIIGDTGEIEVGLSRWNNITFESEMIAEGSIIFGGSINNWQAFSIPLTYASGELPDTAWIAIRSSRGLLLDYVNGGWVNIGSSLRIDNLEFAGYANIQDPIANYVINIYPALATDMLNITAIDNGNLTIYDTTGRIVLERRMSIGVQVLNIASFKSGLYICHFKSSTGGYEAIGRWMKY
jgi:hypothetical protein